jgi:hypothetical protein
MRLGYRCPMGKVALYARKKPQVCLRSGDENDCFGVIEKSLVSAGRLAVGSVIVSHAFLYASDRLLNL